MNERFARPAAMARVDLAHEPDFALGRIEVRPTRRQVAGDSCRETLEPLVMRVLVALARAKGDIVSRDDLIESCWDGVIVGEDAINRCIGRLRKVAEAAGGAFSIETVPRVGYRLKAEEFAAAVSPAIATARPPSAASAVASRPKPETIRPADLSSFGFKKWAAAIAALVLLALAAGGASLWFSRQGSPVGPTDSSVAVLPFTNLSGDPAKEYFSDGFSEELLNDLSNNPHLRVAARTSAFAFKSRNVDVESIARALRVHAIVEGSVREIGNRVRITAQLIDAGNGYNIWSATYDRNLADILTVQDEVAGAIATALTHKLAPVPNRRQIDPAAYRLYLESRQQYWRFSPEGFANSYRLLKKVTAAQPDFVDAFADLANVASNLSYTQPAESDLYRAAASEAVQKALELDPANIKALQLRGVMRLAQENWTDSAADIRALRNANPNDANTLDGLRVYYDNLGFPAEAIAIMRRERALDPLSDKPKLESLGDLLAADHYMEAIGVAHDVLAREPNETWAMCALCIAYAGLGQPQKARGIEVRVQTLNPWPPDFWECEYRVDIAAGNLTGARKILETWAAAFPDKYPSATDIAKGYVELRDFDKASDWFERAYERHEFQLFFLTDFPDGAKYRTTQRWKALTQQPRFRQWQAAHDRVAADLAARHGNPF